MMQIYADARSDCAYVKILVTFIHIRVLARDIRVHPLVHTAAHRMLNGKKKKVKRAKKDECALKQRHVRTN
jgi:hypothetical protein